jgi:hypothetical protein
MQNRTQCFVLCGGRPNERDAFHDCLHASYMHLHLHLQHTTPCSYAAGGWKAPLQETTWSIKQPLQEALGKVGAAASAE